MMTFQEIYIHPKVNNQTREKVVAQSYHLRGKKGGKGGGGELM